MVEDVGDKLLVTAKGRPHVSSHVDSMAGRRGREEGQGGGVGRRGREEGVGGKSEWEGGRDGWEE